MKKEKKRKKSEHFENLKTDRHLEEEEGLIRAIYLFLSVEKKTVLIFYKEFLSIVILKQMKCVIRLFKH